MVFFMVSLNSSFFVLGVISCIGSKQQDQPKGGAWRIRPFSSIFFKILRGSLIPVCKEIYSKGTGLLAKAKVINIFLICSFSIPLSTFNPALS